MNKKQKGLIELLIVVAIILIIAAIRDSELASRQDCCELGFSSRFAAHDVFRRRNVLVHL
jgi:hypothetical protein